MVASSAWLSICSASEKVLKETDLDLENIFIVQPAYNAEKTLMRTFREIPDDFIFDTEIIAQGMMCKLAFQEVPITTRYFAEASSINLTRRVIYGLGILKVLFQYWLHRSNIVRFRKFELK